MTRKALLPYFALSLATLLASGPLCPAYAANSNTLGEALNRCISLLDDVRKAWEDKVTFPANKQLLTNRLGKLSNVLSELADEKVNLTHEVISLGTQPQSDREAIWKNRERLNGSIQKLQDTVWALKNQFRELKPLVPLQFQQRFNAATDELSAGLDLKRSKLEEISLQLTGLAEFNADLIQEEGDTAVKTAKDLKKAVDALKSAVDANRAGAATR